MLDEGHGRLRADNGRKRAENGPKRDEGATESCGPGSRLYVGFVSFVPVRSPLFRAGQHSITCDSPQSAEAGRDAVQRRAEPGPAVTVGRSRGIAVTVASPPISRHLLRHALTAWSRPGSPRSRPGRLHAVR